MEMSCLVYRSNITELYSKVDSTDEIQASFLHSNEQVLKLWRINLFTKTDNHSPECVVGNTLCSDSNGF